MGMLATILKGAMDEKAVEKAYQDDIKIAMGLQIKSILDRSVAEGLEVDCKTTINGIKTDGLIMAKTPDGDIACLLETKYKKNLSDKNEFAKVVCQCCNYLYRLSRLSGIVPQMVVIGDVDSAFIIESSILTDYFITYSDRFVFTTNANNQWIDAPDMYNYILKDANIDAIFQNIIDPIHGKGANKSFRLLISSMIGQIINNGNYTKINIDVSKLGVLFSNFNEMYNDIVPDNNRLLIERFIKFIQNPDNCNLVDVGKQFGYTIDNNGRITTKEKLSVSDRFGIVNLDGTEIGVEIDTYNKFRSYYELLDAADRKYFEQNCDTLLENIDRRRNGDFYTPEVWVNEAHKMISDKLGKDWKDRYLVWDCAAGTKNLTRDYTFGPNNRNLISTTLSVNDVNITKDLNVGCASFEYDFLNDDVEAFEYIMQLKNTGYRLTVENFSDTILYKRGGKGFIERLLNGEPLEILINPPYGKTGSGSFTEGANEKKGMGKTKINTIMVENKIGLCSAQLYAQFVYRITLLRKLFDKADIGLAMYSTFAIQSSQSFKGLREYLRENNFGIERAMIFCAGDFTNCSDSWGIMFSLWETGPFKDKLICEAKKLDSTNNVELIGPKCLYNVDENIRTAEWITSSIGNDKVDTVNLTSALTASNKADNTLTENNIGCYYTGGWNTEINFNSVYLMTACSSQNGIKISIEESNFFKVMSSFCARKLIVAPYSTWENGKDEYMVPDIHHEKYAQFMIDSIIYSLFNTSSCQSSLRGIQFNNTEWSVINHFFWMSKQEVLELAVANNNQEVIDDITNNSIDERFTGKEYYSERFVYCMIKYIEECEDKQFSSDAQLVLNMARELVKITFSDREIMNRADAEMLKDFGVRGNKLDGADWHINTWDAGWYQIKGLAQINHKNELEQFREAYKALEDRMRPLVYKLGFLYR